MNQEIKRRWVEALRSGEYKQGQGLLRADDEYCCLGVLCDILHPDSWDSDVAAEGEEVLWRSIVNGESGYAVLPWSVAHEAGLASCIPVVNGRGLADYNDEGTPFSEIADLIEKHL